MKEPFDLMYWPWGKRHVTANGLTFAVLLIVAAFLIMPPLVKLAGWYFKFWGVT